MRRRKEGEQNKKRSAAYLPWLLGIVIGVIGGIVIAHIDTVSDKLENMSFAEFMGNYLQLLLMMVIAVFLQIILHEGGHLVCGLLSGYRFSSFRIGSLMLLRTGEGWSVKRLSLPGTGGQCLMSPPEPRDGAFPYVLYNLGGALANLIAAVLFFVWCRMGVRSGLPAVFCAAMALFGLLFAITNGVPIKTKMIANDGYNAIALGKNELARRSFWLQLKINELQMEGTRLRDMPKDWFDLPEDADLHNPMISTIGVFAENRYMDQQDFLSAKEQIEALQSDRCSVAGFYLGLLALDRLYLEILEKGADADLSALEKQPVKSIRRSMKNFPSVIRTEYAAAKCVKRDEKEAEILMARFEKCVKTYPAKADIDSERELIELLGKGAAQ